MCVVTGEVHGWGRYSSPALATCEAKPTLVTPSNNYARNVGGRIQINITHRL